MALPSFVAFWVLQVVDAQADTVKVIDAELVANFYSSLLDKQSAQFTILVTVLSLVVVLILGATCWWNFRGAKQFMNKEIDKYKKEVRIATSKEVSNIEESVSKKVSDKVESLDKSIHSELGEYKKDLEKNIRRQQAELSRVFALHCHETNSFLVAATWWFDAAISYYVCEVNSFCQISVDAGVANLSDCYKKETLQEEDEEKLNAILEDIERIPDFYASQKKEAKRLVKQIKKKITNPES